MIKTSNILLIALIVGSSLCVIKPIAPIRRATLLQNDYFYRDLTQYYDFSDASYPIQVTGQGGIANNQTDAYMHYHFQEYRFEELSWIKQLSNDTIIYCYDGRNLIKQTMNGEGKVFGDHEMVTFPAADVVCTDVVEYKHRDYLYVGCIHRKTSQGQDKALFILTWDLIKKSIIKTIVVEQDDGFMIKNRLQLAITRIEDQTNDQNDFLMLYDQGNTNAMVHRGNDQVRLFRNLEYGSLKYYKLLIVNTVDFAIVYDYIPYQSSVLLSGRIQGPKDQYVSMAQCMIDLRNEAMNCNPNNHKTFTIKRGKVGFDLLNNLYQIDLDKKSLVVSIVTGSFSDQDWSIRNIAYQMRDLDLFDGEEHLYLRAYTGNGLIGVINYGTLNGHDAGYTGISFVSGFSWKTEGVAAAEIGKSIVFGNVEQTVRHQVDSVGLMRPLHPYLLVPGIALLNQKNLVSISASDQETISPSSTSTTFRLISSIYDGLQIRDTFGNIVIGSGQTKFVTVPVSAIVEGNAIHAEVSSEGGVVRGKGVQGVGVKITWLPSHDHLDIQHYAFDGRKALVQTTSGKVFFYSCDRITIEQHACHQYASYPLPEMAQRFKNFMTYKDTAFTWTCDSTSCYVLIIQDDGDVSRINLSHDTKSVFYSNDPEDDLEMRMYATDGVSVKFWVGPRHEPGGLILWYELTAENSGQDWFCPMQVTHCPDSVNVFEVLNDCEGRNQKILKYKISGARPEYWESSRLDRPEVSPYFCPMGSEFVIGTLHSVAHEHLYSTGTKDGLEYYSVPGDLTADGFYHISCLSRDRKVVIYARETDNSLKATVMMGNRGEQQLLRYPTIISGLNAHRAHGYPSFDGVLHWFQSEEDHFFFVTFDTPKLELVADHVTQDTEVTIKIVFSNEERTQTMERKVTVTAA